MASADTETQLDPEVIASPKGSPDCNGVRRAYDEASNGNITKKTASKRKKKRSKKVFVPLPSLQSHSGDLNFSVNFSQRLGRHAIAKRDLKTGELILREAPVATVVRPQFQGDVCHGCLRKVGEQEIEVQTGYYGFCSKACAQSIAARRELAEVHGLIPAISRELGIEQSLLLFILEVDILSSTDRDDASMKLEEKDREKGKKVPLVKCGPADVDVLVTYWEQKGPEWRSIVSTACKRLSDAVRTTKAYKPSPLQKLQELASIIEMNSHGYGVGNEENADQALGLFPTLSMFNHSCRPNCSFGAVGQEMQVRALCDIPMGEQLHVAYVNLTEDRQTRRKQLMHSKHFVCACERCSEPLETSTDRFLEGCACSSSSCPGPMVSPESALQEVQHLGGEDFVSQAITTDQEWHCTTCGKVEVGPADDGKRQVVAKLKRDWQLAMMLRRDQGPLSIEAEKIFERILAAAPETLHPLHVLQIDCLMPMVNINRGRRDLQKAAQYLARLIAAFDKTVCQPTAELGNLLDLQSQLLAERIARAPPPMTARLQKQAREVTQRAVCIRSLTLGDDHPLVQQTTSRLRQL